MATTTNYGWTTPDDTALVKDGAAAIRTLGSSVDTTTKNLNPETTLGDIAYRSSTANVNTRLPLGTAGQVLKVNSGATAPEWSSDNAGMTNPMTTTGDTIYSSSGSTPARLGIGTAGQVLRVNSGANAPEWATPASAAPASANSFTANSESTTSGTFTALTTAQAVTLTTGTKVLVILGCTAASNNNDGGFAMAYSVSGATTIAMGDSGTLEVSKNGSTTANVYYGYSRHSYITVTAGSNTFTAGFRRIQGIGTANFYDRYLTVIDLGS